MPPDQPTPQTEALENDIRELHGAEPAELARRLIERGWTQARTEALYEHADEHEQDFDERLRTEALANRECATCGDPVYCKSCHDDDIDREGRQ